MLNRACAALAYLLIASSIAYGQGGAPNQNPNPIPVPNPNTNANTGGIRGKIVVPVVGFGERLEVLIERQGEIGQVFKVIYTDSLGNYYIDGLPLGSYTVVVKLDGFKEVRERVDMGSPQYGANIPTVNIILSRADPDEEELKAARNAGVVDIRELNRKFPKKAVQEFEKGQEEDRKGNNNRAIERLESAVKIAPDFDYAHNQLGMLYEKAKRIADAEREYKRANELNPRLFQPLVNLGRLYVNQVETRNSEGAAAIAPLLEQARTALEAAVKLEPFSAMGYYLLGVVYYRSGLDDEAEEALEQALDEGDKGPAHLVLANLYVRQQKWAAALEHLDAYLKVDPKSPERPHIEQVRSKIVKNLKAAP